MNDAAPGASAPFSPATAAGLLKARTISIPRISPEGALTGVSEDTELMHLPDPVGHFMLVALPEVEVRTAHGVYVPDSVSERERTASVVGKVIELGPDCYVDPPPLLPDNLPDGAIVNLVAARPRFPSGPWCKKGDTVLFSRYAGKRFRVEGVEFRMLTDDEVVATIPDGAHVGGL